MAGVSDICEKFFPGDTARQANAMIGLSAFLHGDGVFVSMVADVCHPTP
jgi:hypothetical protein